MKNINAEFENLSRALEFDIILSDIASYANIEKNKNKILSFRPLNKLEDITDCINGLNNEISEIPKPSNVRISTMTATCTLVSNETASPTQINVDLQYS